MQYIDMNGNIQQSIRPLALGSNVFNGRGELVGRACLYPDVVEPPGATPPALRQGQVSNARIGGLSFQDTLSALGVLDRNEPLSIRQQQQSRSLRRRELENEAYFMGIDLASVPQPRSHAEAMDIARLYPGREVRLDWHDGMVRVYHSRDGRAAVFRTETERSGPRRFEGGENPFRDAREYTARTGRSSEFRNRDGNLIRIDPDQVARIPEGGYEPPRSGMTLETIWMDEAAGLPSYIPDRVRRPRRVERPLPSDSDDDV